MKVGDTGGKDAGGVDSKLTGLVVRRGVVDDAAALAEFGRRLFAATFGPDNDPAQMQSYLDANYSEALQTAELSNPSEITLLAEIDDILIGYAQVRSHAPPDCVSGPAPLELHRFYIDSPFHGSGAAQLLMAEVFEAAYAHGGRTLWLSVWESNPRAIRFYLKCGYTDVGSTVFMLGGERQTDRVLSATLSAPLPAPL